MAHHPGNTTHPRASTRARRLDVGLPLRFRPPLLNGFGLGRRRTWCEHRGGLNRRNTGCGSGRGRWRGRWRRLRDRHCGRRTAGDDRGRRRHRWRRGSNTRHGNSGRRRRKLHRIADHVITAEQHPGGLLVEALCSAACRRKKPVVAVRLTWLENAHIVSVEGESPGDVARRVDQPGEADARAVADAPSTTTVTRKSSPKLAHELTVASLAAATAKASAGPSSAPASAAASAADCARARAINVADSRAAATTTTMLTATMANTSSSA